jgi:hypothetical protein
MTAIRLRQVISKPLLKRNRSSFRTLRDGRVIDRQTLLRHEFLEIAQTDRKSEIPPDASNDHGGLELAFPEERCRQDVMAPLYQIRSSNSSARAQALPPLEHACHSKLVARKQRRDALRGDIGPARRIERCRPISGYAVNRP